MFSSNKDSFNQWLKDAGIVIAGYWDDGVKCPNLLDLLYLSIEDEGGLNEEIENNFDYCLVPTPTQNSLKEKHDRYFNDCPYVEAWIEGEPVDIAELRREWKDAS